MVELNLRKITLTEFLMADVIRIEYKNDTIICKEVFLTPVVLKECRRIVANSEDIKRTLTTTMWLGMFLGLCCSSLGEEQGQPNEGKSTKMRSGCTKLGSSECWQEGQQCLMSIGIYGVLKDKGMMAPPGLQGGKI
ncbi:unnamed protein product [Ilex paraguariensis]|uniref:Uncharacterized protein n=1 Tax=Ilex paraguariensis TaxID=185542 RepID=A0ABC8R3W5_9AQUA